MRVLENDDSREFRTIRSAGHPEASTGRNGPLIDELDPSFSWDLLCGFFHLFDEPAMPIYCCIAVEPVHGQGGDVDLSSGRRVGDAERANVRLECPVSAEGEDVAFVRGGKVVQPWS